MHKTSVREQQRTWSEIQEHYGVEREIAQRLREASRFERRTLYQSLYNELYQRVPHHPQLTRKSSPEQRKAAIRNELKLLSSLLGNDKKFLEVGSGDCALIFEVARFVEDAYAVDVSETITQSSIRPDNFKLIISDGCSIPVPASSIDIIYSNQLMEHLHPDDAGEQLKNILNALVPGGLYICITPNRLSGPHDISKHFDAVATGFHLKEYTIGELSEMLMRAGFNKVRILFGAKGIYFKFPLLPALICERVLERLPSNTRRRLANLKPIQLLINNRLIGFKAS